MILHLLLLLSAPGHAAEGQPVWTLLMPFGVPQAVQGRPAPALAFGLIQGAGAGVATWSSVAMRQAAIDQDIDRELRLRMVSAGAVAVGAGGYLGSVMDGAHHHDLRTNEPMTQEARGRAMAEAALAWRASTALTPRGGAKPGV